VAGATDIAGEEGDHRATVRVSLSQL
jgi:hypothetical protein